ncbi:fermitin family homolog 2-like [Babylonia areolata]|uniref:fermitin family homolog 2-like n=1 Tax=Babylonia areolata TaxID=304850 RepID=UPI003FD65D2B
MAFIGDAGRVDGSWELTIYVTDVQQESTLRVNGDLHIGGVMLKLVQSLDIAQDWSDHGLWWPERNQWLLRPQTTLDQYGVQADCRLTFTPMHKALHVQLPDLQVHNLRVDFSCKCFKAVVKLCKELGISHPEELSLMRKWDREDLKRVAKEVKGHKKKKESGEAPPGQLSPSTSGLNSSSGSIDGRLSPCPSRSPQGPSPTSTLNRSGGTSLTIPGYSPMNGTLSPDSSHNLSFEGSLESSLANSPQVSSKDAFQVLLRPKNLAEKARLNCAWLDSSRSLYEQGVQENDVVMLRFKYFNFYDLNPRYDAVRINQLYEQAKWSLISEEIDCTEEEMMVFAALQFQAQQQTGVPQTPPEEDGVDKGPGPLPVEKDEVGEALADLQSSLEGSSLSSPCGGGSGGGGGGGDLTHIPELADFVKFFKPKKLTLKSYKSYWTTFKDTHLAFYRSQEEASGTPVFKINVKGCEIHPDVNLSTKRYGIKLFVPDTDTDDGMSEIYLRFDTETQYCRWMSACKLASKGRTMCDSSYEAEVSALQTFLAMQHPSSASPSSPPALDPSQVDIHPEDFVAPRFCKKFKTKSLVQRVMEAHANVRTLGLTDAKMAYIKAWQSLPEFGITYFRVRMTNSKKEELIGVASNRVIRMDLHSGDSLKTWRYNVLQSWRVNWENGTVILGFEGQNVTFEPLECSCKTVHEYIGGYIFLSTRATDKSQSLNEELYHKLTGGWS